MFNNFTSKIGAVSHPAAIAIPLKARALNIEYMCRKK